MKLSFLLMAGALCALLTLPAWGQTGVGTPSSSIQFSTNSATSGGVAPLAHAQVAPFGSIFGNATWASIGRSPFAPPGASASEVPYGIRIQKEGNFALFNLLERNNGFFGSSEDLILGFGESTSNTLRVRFISDQFTNTFRDLMTFSSASIGINTQSFTGVNAINRTTSSLAATSLRGLTIVESTTTFGFNTGVAGDVSNRTGSGVDYAGRFSVSSSNAPTRAAGFFTGDIVYSGSLQGPSDRKLKRNIKEETGHLDRLMQLNTYTYNFKTDEYDYMALPTELQHGLIAQELEKVYPELVKEYAAPINKLNEEGTDVEQDGMMYYKSVNYTNLVPVLIGAIKEMQTQTTQELTDKDVQLAERDAQIASNEARIANLEAALAELKGTASDAPANTSWSNFGEAELMQNTPNPFTEQTTIRYNLPENFESAVLFVYDMNGRQVNSFNNLSRKGSLTIEGSTLDAGMYIYSLIIDGQEVATKRMILTK
ncbi:MAG: tail fiber domain-containing protein [Bacteroidota bacterium]